MLKERRMMHALLLAVAVLSWLSLPLKAHAVPAAPITHTLSQSDGRSFQARQWGDEFLHGWETTDGYTIIFDKDRKSWTYAVRGPEGKLVGSSKIVGKDNPPQGNPKHVRPSKTAVSPGPVMTPKTSVSPIISTTAVNGPTLATPSAVTVNIPVFLINFKNTSTTYTPDQFNTLLFGTGNYSMNDYYLENSYGAFSVSAGPSGIAGWFKASNTHDYYGYNQGFVRAAQLAKEAVVAADNAGFNFAAYDHNGDCYVDVADIIHQGGGDEVTGNGSDIWSHQWTFTDAGIGEYVTNDTCIADPTRKVKVNDYVMQPETQSGTISTMGVFAHENAHALFNLPDLYDVYYNSEGIGDWSLMAGGVWNYVTNWGDRPAHMDAWCKYAIGWVTPTEVTGTLVDQPIVQASSAPDVYKFRLGNPFSGEYFLVENRQKTGFDAGLPGSGLLIWHIDGNTISNKLESNEVNAFVCYPGGPSCAGDHYGVKLIQADSAWNLEMNSNRGDAGDPYPGLLGNTSFTDASFPSANLYNTLPSGVSITGISASGATMYATLSSDTSLNVTKTGFGSGTVVSSPSGIDCGADCFESYPKGTTVNLTAIPDPGFVFGGWSGDADCSDGVVTMDAAKVCTAIFYSPITLGDAVDNTSLTWMTGGDTEWGGQTAVSLFGGSAAQSGAIPIPKWSSWMETTVTGPATLTYYWKVSAPDYQNLRFLIDSVEQTAIYHETDWQLMTYSIPYGTHTLRWEYKKYLSLVSTSGTGWVDQVIVQPQTDWVAATAPNGGEVWKVGTTHPITWRYAGNPGASVKIELLSGTSVVGTIAASAPIGTNGTGSYNWNIPNRQTLGSDYKIRITSTSNSSYTDTSDGSFTISK